MTSLLKFFIFLKFKEVEEMDKVKVIIWGFGAMGSGMADMLLEKDGVDIVGVCDLDKNKLGKSIFEILDTEKGDNPVVEVEKDIEKIVKENDADVALLATDSFTEKAFDKIKFCLENELNVVSTAEERS